MEPPAKRLRILQSVEVDETDPEYIEAKQKQQRKFKSRLERIFDKYGSMHESMSDEIDFKTGKVVVDRGHIRRMQRQMQRQGPSLVDNLLEPTFAQGEDLEEEEEGQVESEDELAPTQTTKKERMRAEDNEEPAQLSEQPSAPMVATTPRTMSTALPQAFQMPNTPNQATDLYQQIQQTPLDQQMQAALFANLNQIQAAQQALASLLSILQGTPNGQTPQVPVSALPPQLSATDSVRPAADPKWYFPPISAVKESPQACRQRSSPPVFEPVSKQIQHRVESPPLVTRRKSPTVRIEKRPAATNVVRNHSTQQTGDEILRSSLSIPQHHSDNISKSDTDPVSTMTPTRKGRRVRSDHKYDFTEEDYVYISEKQDVYNMTLKGIKASKAQWSDWPLSMFYSRWQAYRKGRQLHPQEPSTTDLNVGQDTPLSHDHEENFYSSIEIPETSSAEHRLLTPNSLEQGSVLVDRAAIPSSSHFDDDELELLSLAGVDVDDMLTVHDNHGDEDYPTPDEPLPSIEGAEFRTEDELQNEMLKAEQSPTPAPLQPKILPSTIPETQESATAVSPPSQKRKAVRKPQLDPAPRPRAPSNSSDDLDLIGSNDDPATPRTYIKRESLTPQATRILCSSPALKTPRPPLQSSGMVAKSTGKLDRRAYLNDVKKSWARANGKTPVSQKRKRRSFYDQTEVLKRAKVGVELGDSEDELAV